jgi:hypothetical protein
MPSPFPGMNPFLEQEDVWSDFHNRFIPVAAEAIGSQVQPAYIVKIDQNVFVQEPEGDEKVLGRPDVYVAEDTSGLPLGVGGVALVAPTKARLVPAVTADKDLFIEIRDGKDRKLVTAVELLSPSNKEHGSTREQYLSKRNTYFKSGVHLVEIDLLRGGPRMPLAPKPSGDYCIVVSRAQDRPEADVWSIQLRDPLPTIPIPLRPDDGDAHLNLQEILNRVYDAAGYENYIHRTAPEPALRVEDRDWADQLLQTSRRGAK